MKLLYPVVIATLLSLICGKAHAQVTCQIEYQRKDVISGERHFQTKPIAITLFKTNIENGYQMKDLTMAFMKNESGMQAKFAFTLTNMGKKTALFENGSELFILKFEDGSVDTLRSGLEPHIKKRKRRFFCELTFELSEQVMEKLRNGQTVQAFKIDCTSFDISLPGIVPAFSNYCKECLELE